MKLKRRTIAVLLCVGMVMTSGFAPQSEACYAFYNDCTCAVSAETCESFCDGSAVCLHEYRVSDLQPVTCCPPSTSGYSSCWATADRELCYTKHRCTTNYQVHCGATMTKHRCKENTTKDDEYQYGAVLAVSGNC